jgi:hypothetical protein
MTLKTNSWNPLVPYLSAVAVRSGRSGKKRQGTLHQNWQQHFSTDQCSIQVNVADQMSKGHQPLVKTLADLVEEPIARAKLRHPCLEHWHKSGTPTQLLPAWRPSHSR